MRLGKKVYIIILNFQTWKDTIECLESVFSLEYPNFQVVLVDNFSENESVFQFQLWADEYKVKYTSSREVNSSNGLNYRKLNYTIEDYAENYRKTAVNLDLVIIKSKVNNGFAAGNNIGIKYVLQQNGFDFIWLLNNDTITEKSALTALVKHMEVSVEVGICGSVLLDYQSPEILQGVGGFYNKYTTSATEVFKGKALSEELFKIPHKINYPIGAALFVRNDFLNDVGLMSEDYFLFFEEMDWTLRGEKFGWHCGYSPDSLVWHKGSSTINNNGKSKTKLGDYFGIRSKILFTKKFFPQILPFVYINILGLIINRIRKRQFDRIGTIVKIARNPEMDHKLLL